jgi:hypothetical protein
MMPNGLIGHELHCPSLLREKLGKSGRSAFGQIQPASVAMRMASTRFRAFSLVTTFVR